MSKRRTYKDGIYDVEEYDNGDKEWYLNGNLHRNDGPAIEWSDGTKEWYLNGKLHRGDGPAVERSNGTKKWFLNGNLHRDDGPAIEWSNGAKEWYLNDKEIKQFICKFPHEDWVEIEALNYIGPCKIIGGCFIELPIEVGGSRVITYN